MATVTRRTAAVIVGALLVSGGVFAVAGGAFAGTLQQSEEASFEVSNLTAPETLPADGNLTVNATVSNPSDQAATQVVKYRFDGTVLAQQTVRLNPGESTEVTFEVNVDGFSSGTYVHGVFADDTGAVAQIAVAESFRVTGLDAPRTVAAGEQLELTTTLTNPNDEELTQEVEIRLNGEVLQREEVTLDGEESRTVTFTVDTTGIAPRSYFFAVLTRDFGEFSRVTVTGGAPPADSAVTFDNQSSEGTTVVIDEVTLSEGGFVAIHDASLLDGNVVGSVIGVSEYLGPGTYENVTITLFDVPGADFDTTQLEETQTLIAMPHFDSGNNQQYDFVRTGGQVDGPYTANGGVVTDAAVVRIGEPTETPGPGTPNETETPTETVTPGTPNETDTPGTVTGTPGTPNETDTPGTMTGTPGTPNETDTPAPGPGTSTETETPGTATGTVTETGTATGTLTGTETGTVTGTPGSPTEGETTQEPVTLTDTPADTQSSPLGILQTVFLGVVSLGAIAIRRR